MKRRLLLVDDDQAVLVTLKAVLELNHFDVDTAISGAEARKKLRTNEYEMVLTDVSMETDDAGLEVLREARAQSYRPVTAILTAYPLQDAWRKDFVESFLIKPIATRQLVQQIENLLAHRGPEPGS